MVSNYVLKCCSFRIKKSGVLIANRAGFVSISRFNPALTSLGISGQKIFPFLLKLKPAVFIPRTHIKACNCKRTCVFILTTHG